MVTAVAAALDDLAPRRNLPVVADVILAEDLVRHTLVPWAPQARGRAERTALVRACFEDAYGNGTEGWRMAADGGAYAVPAPASAVARDVVKTLATTLGQRRIRLGRVVPFFAAVFDR